MYITGNCNGKTTESQEHIKQTVLEPRSCIKVFVQRHSLKLGTAIKDYSGLGCHSETAKYEQNVLRSADYTKQLNNSP